MKIKLALSEKGIEQAIKEYENWQKTLETRMAIGLGTLFVCIKYRGPKVRGRALLRTALLPPGFLGSRHCVFIHEIHNSV